MNPLETANRTEQNRTEVATKRQKREKPCIDRWKEEDKSEGKAGMSSASFFHDPFGASLSASLKSDGVASGLSPSFLTFSASSCVLGTSPAIAASFPPCFPAALVLATSSRERVRWEVEERRLSEGEEADWFE